MISSAEESISRADRTERLLWRSRWGLVLPLLLLLGAGSFFRFYLYQYYLADEYDVVGYIFAAETFARGRLKVPVPLPDDPAHRTTDEAPQFFRTFGVVPHTFNDRDAKGHRYEYMYSRYLPGHPLVLFLGRFIFGSYAPVPLVLILLSAWGMYLILRLSAGETPARVGLWLMPLSPFFLAFGTSLLSHGSTFFFLTFATLAYIHMDRSGSVAGRFLGGLAAGFLYVWAAACRPLTGACFLLALAVREAALIRCNYRRLPQRWTALILGALIVLAPLLWYNAQLTGHPLRLPFHEYWPRNTLGFTGLTEMDTSSWTSEDFEKNKSLFKGDEMLNLTRDRYRQHTPFLALENLALAWSEFDRSFLVWPGGLYFLAGLLFWLRRDRSAYRGLFLLQALLVAAGQFFFFERGAHPWGPRYYYEALLPAFLLLAPLLPAAFRRLSPNPRLWPGLAVFLTVSAVVYTCTAGYQPLVRQLEERRFRAGAAENIKKKVKTPALVFLPQTWPEFWDTQYSYVGIRHPHLVNPPDFKADMLFAVNNGKANDVLYNHPDYRDRNVYELDHQGEVLPVPRIPPVGSTGAGEGTSILAAGPGRSEGGFPPTVWTNSLGLEFRRVPAGGFLMGGDEADPEAVLSEKPLHRVEITYSFLMGRFEVTVGQFQRFVKDTGYETEAERGQGALSWRQGTWRRWWGFFWRNPGFRQGPDHPVTCLGLADAEAFLAWLNRNDPAKPPGWVYRLPTEAEWEYAARGADGRRYPWGDRWDPVRCNFQDTENRDGFDYTAPVGAHSPAGDSPFGVADLAGNVSEMTADRFSLLFYFQGATTNPYAAVPATARVFKGGAWNRNPFACRSSYRDRMLPGELVSNLGLRVVLVPVSVPGTVHPDGLIRP
ncbi:MAG: SUMF1/EgtB/PvdO family nonheme iron enzyme [Thermodesulfobacteriota bacterium]